MQCIGDAQTHHSTDYIVGTASKQVRKSVLTAHL